MHEHQHYIVAYDVTRRKEFEHALGEESAFRKGMEDALSTGMRAIDMSTRITYVNPAFCAMTGFSENELIGTTPPYPYWPDQGYEAHQHNLELTLQGKVKKEGFELMLRRRTAADFGIVPGVAAGRQRWQTNRLDGGDDGYHRTPAQQRATGGIARTLCGGAGWPGCSSVGERSGSERSAVRQRSLSPALWLDPSQSRFATACNMHGDAICQATPVSNWICRNATISTGCTCATGRSNGWTGVRCGWKSPPISPSGFRAKKCTGSSWKTADHLTPDHHGRNGQQPGVRLNQPLAAISNYCNGCVARIEAGTTTPQELLG